MYGTVTHMTVNVLQEIKMLLSYLFGNKFEFKKEITSFLLICLEYSKYLS